MDDQAFEIAGDGASTTARAGRDTTSSDVIRLAGLWVAAGALFKLFAGSPNDLPPMVQSWYSDPNVTFRVAISAELIVVALALFRPRLAWLPLIGMFAVFDYVLWPLVREGAASCGCLGSSVEIPPWAMMAIDSLLLLAILFTRPWSALTKRPFRPLVLLPLIGVAVWAPWQIFKTPKVKLPVAAVNDSEPAPPETAAHEGQSTPPVIPAGWALPDPLPDFYEFQAQEWIGKELYAIDLYGFLDVDFMGTDCHVVFYRQQCDHCAQHLQELSVKQDAGELGPFPLVLVRVPEKGDTQDNEVTVVKPLEHIPLELPMLERGYGFRGLQTPFTMDVEALTVTKVENVELEEEEGE